MSGSQPNPDRADTDPSVRSEGRPASAGETVDGDTAIGMSVDPESKEGGQRATFDSDEIRRVLAAYELGDITGIQIFEAGSRQAPKLRVSSTRGEYLLKRRVARPELVRRAVFNHGFQLHLEEAGLPVARLVGTARENRSMLLEDCLLYTSDAADE